MKKARPPKRQPAPHPVFILIGSLREIADDPDVTEGALRHAVRTAAGVLDQQQRLIERFRQQLTWRYGILAALCFVLAGYQIGKLIWDHW